MQSYSRLIYHQWLRDTSDDFYAVSDTPMLDARLILCFCANLSHTELLTKKDSDFIENHIIIAQCSLLKKLRLRGFPIAYLTGQKEFYHHIFYVCPGVLIPRPDSECLIEVIKDAHARDSYASLRDVGTGPGTLALTLAVLYPRWQITGSDISPESKKMFKKNQECLNARNAHFLHANLLHGGEEKYDIIIANLPYLTPKETKERSHWKEPPLALNGKGKDGLKLIKKLIRQAQYRCQKIYLEADPAQMPALSDYLRKHGFSHIQIFQDLQGLQRIILGCRGALLPGQGL